MFSVYFLPSPEKPNQRFQLNRLLTGVIDPYQEANQSIA